VNGYGGEFCAALEKAGAGNTIHKYPCTGVDFPQGVLEDNLKLLEEFGWDGYGDNIREEILTFPASEGIQHVRVNGSPWAED
jgi:hypothetical protein